MRSPIPRQTPAGRSGSPNPHGLTPCHDKDRADLLAVVIPHDDQIPVRIQRIAGSPLAALQRIVHGSARAMRLGPPAATLYVNEEGSALGLPVNVRAALMGRAHRALTLSGGPCEAGLFVGDAVILGPSAGDGRDTGAPQEFLDLFTHTGQFRIEVSVLNEPGRWHSNSLRFEEVSHAYAWALSLARRWVLVQDVRVVPDIPDIPDATPAHLPLPQEPDTGSGHESQPGQGEPS